MLVSGVWRVGGSEEKKFERGKRRKLEKKTMKNALWTFFSSLCFISFCLSVAIVVAASGVVVVAACVGLTQWKWEIMVQIKPNVEI